MAAIMWRLALGLQQRSKFLRVCFLPPPPAPAPAASKPSAYQLPLSLLGRGSYRGSCTHCCLLCSELTGCSLHVGHLCSATPATRPTINSCPITFDFHFRHSLLEHNQPSAYFILLRPTYRSFTSLRLTSGKSKRLSRQCFDEEECETGMCVKQRVSAVGSTGSKTGLRFGGRAILRRREGGPRHHIQQARLRTRPAT